MTKIKLEKGERVKHSLLQVFSCNDSTDTATLVFSNISLWKEHPRFSSGRAMILLLCRRPNSASGSCCGAAASPAGPLGLWPLSLTHCHFPLAEKVEMIKKKNR